MKSVLVAASILLLLTGCADLNAFLLGRPPAYYTDPNSPGYQEQVFRALCEQCGQAFTYSKDNLDHWTWITCPFDGYKQNLHLAVVRYEQAQQRSQQQNAQMAYQGFQAWNQYQVGTAQRQAAYMNCVNQCTSMANIYSPNPGNRFSGHLGDCATYCMNR